MLVRQDLPLLELGQHHRFANESANRSIAGNRLAQIFQGTSIDVFVLPAGEGEAEVVPGHASLDFTALGDAVHQLSGTTDFARIVNVNQGDRRRINGRRSRQRVAIE